MQVDFCKASHVIHNAHRFKLYIPVYYEIFTVSIKWNVRDLKFSEVFNLWHEPLSCGGSSSENICNSWVEDRVSNALYWELNWNHHCTYIVYTLLTTKFDPYPVGVLSRVRATLDGFLDWILNLLPPFIHNSWLQLIIASSLVSTL
jgi:hypothetical protein